MGLDSEGVSKCQEDKIGLERFAYELHDRLCCISVPTFAGEVRLRINLIYSTLINPIVD